MRTKKEKSYIFTLAGVCLTNVDILYGFTPNDINGDSTKNITKLTDLDNANKCAPISISFFGESKELHKCNVSMIDFNSKSDTHALRYHCFWCKNPFDTLGIGCPISFVPQKFSRKYTSVINQNKYVIEEDTTKNSLSIIDGLNLTGKAYYQTDGVFCSFNCCSAFIADNKKNPLYKSSRVLLVNMYNDMFLKQIKSISPAPHWKTLTQYGGHLRINDFRESLDNVEYKNQGCMNDVNIPKQVSLATLFEKKLKF